MLNKHVCISRCGLDIIVVKDYWVRRICHYYTWKMSTIRSSVRPKSSKLPWGTILKPEFGLGHQKMTEYEIDQTVERLNTVKQPKEREYPRNGPLLDQDTLDEMLRRLTKCDKSKIPESDRRMQKSIYKDMGVVSSYAWKGYN